VPFTDPPAAPARASRLVRFFAAIGLVTLAGCNTPRPARPADMEAYHLRFAQRLVAMNPGITYTTPSPDPLLAIPILEVELNADGGVRHIEVTRRPRDPDAQDTIQIAIDAVRRAAPYGDLRNVGKPWKITEVFLFDDQRRFKPRTLD
jgi:hypothetical protein